MPRSTPAALEASDRVRRKGGTTAWRTREFRQLYPGAKLLAVSASDLGRTKRAKFMARIAGGEWDAVILTHEAFDRVPLRPETQKAYLGHDPDKPKRDPTRRHWVVAQVGYRGDSCRAPAVANRHENGTALSPDIEEFILRPERNSMLASLKRKTVLAAVGLCATAGVLASAPTASASTGNWGWPQRSTPVRHGRTALTTFGMECLTAAGCTAQPGTTLTFSPQGGASVINPNNVTFPFNRSDTGAQVGTCATTAHSWIQCTLSSPVSLAYTDELFGNANGSGVSLDVPYYLEPGTVVGEFTWYDPNGMSDTYPPTETILAVVSR